MDEASVRVSTAEKPADRGSPTSRRGFLGGLTVALGGLIGLVLAVPARAYVLSPLRKRGREGEFDTLAPAQPMEVGVPRAFPIIDERQDAWVKYPREPVGSVWLIRQPAGQGAGARASRPSAPTWAAPSTCSADGKSFLCPCHTSSFDFDGQAPEPGPARGRWIASRSSSPTGDDPEVRVKFQRFRTQSEEKIPLV